MIIHINQQRYDFILSQGYKFSLDGFSLDGEPNIDPGNYEYHLLQGERATCDKCGIDEVSVDANSPAELETIKRCMEFHFDPEEHLRKGRQSLYEFVRQTVTRQ